VRQWGEIFNYAATLSQGSITFEAPMPYTCGFIGLFTIGGLTGVSRIAGLDIHLAETYFVVAHFHYVMVGDVVGIPGGIHFWWPKITGRIHPELWSKLSALTIFIGFNLTFFPQLLSETTRLCP
jgi:cytochrome c oxidase subunit 1